MFFVEMKLFHELFTLFFLVISVQFCLYFCHSLTILVDVDVEYWKYAKIVWTMKKNIIPANIRNVNVEKTRFCTPFTSTNIWNIMDRCIQTKFLNDWTTSMVRMRVMIFVEYILLCTVACFSSRVFVYFPMMQSFPWTCA